MRKAYDRVEWNFLEAIHCCFGFPDRWVNLFMKCITSVKYCVKVNNDLSDYVTL